MPSNCSRILVESAGSNIKFQFSIRARLVTVVADPEDQPRRSFVSRFERD
jgi:hypothetical protein